MDGWMNATLDNCQKAIETDSEPFFLFFSTNQSAVGAEFKCGV